MKKLLVVLLAITISVGAFSQTYKQAVGLKLGYGLEFTYKTFMNPTNAIDLGVSLGFFSTNYFDLTVRGFYLWHFDIPVDGLSWYIGPGAYLGPRFYSWGGYSEVYFYTSVNMMGGVEYKIPNVPLVVSADVTPGVRFGGGYSNKVGFATSYGGVGIKYIF